MKEIRIGHSPDPDDAFMFYGFATGAVKIDGYDIVHVMKGIQELNMDALSDDQIEVSALSVHMYLKLQDRYESMNVGSSVGRGYGPRLVAKEKRSLESLKGCKIALPGEFTTATLVARMLLPEFEEVQTDFLDVTEAINRGDADAGVVIHEVQLTYSDLGFHLVADLAELFSEKNSGLPLPLGLNCVRRNLSPELKQNIRDAYIQSVEYAMENRKEAVDYCMEFARGMESESVDEFVGMYVNEDSLVFKDDMVKAMGVLEAYMSA